MALLIEQTPDITAGVTAAVVDTYTARRERVQEVSLADLVAGSVSVDLSAVTAVVAGDLRVVEIVAEGYDDLDRLAPATWTLAGRGWDVIVLVPCNRVGDAHASLRAAPCLLQPWWFDEHGVWFGALETP
jgi:hypothetical protein